MQANHHPPSAEFVRRTQPYRRELLAHCYRMLGSLDDAEDLVQETYLRAWRGYADFGDRSSLRTWLYKIATNACLTALTHHSRRVLPSGLNAATRDPAADSSDGTKWLGVLPDALVTSESDDPAAIVARRDSLRLALIAALQLLPGRQRAVLLLRDVLGYSAAEVAQQLDTSAAAVKSTLQRARAHIDEIATATEHVGAPSDPHARALLAEYISAFENSDAAALERILHRDARIELPPARTWFEGKRTCMAFLRAEALGARGDWRMHPTIVNGQPAAATYHRDADGIYRAFGIAVLSTSIDAIIAITVFGDPVLVSRCGFPAELPPD